MYQKSEAVILMGNWVKLYQEMAAMLKAQLEWQGHRQTFHTLLSLMVGVLMSRDVRLGRIAAKGFVDGNIESVEQRYRRWLKNKHIKPQLIYDPLAKQLLFSRKRRRLRLQIDRTLVKNKFNVLMVSVYHRKRAIPLVWLVLPHTGSCSSQHWQPLLNRVSKLISKRSEVILLGDREFGTVDLMRFCQQKGWEYVLRVKRNHHVADPHNGFPLAWHTLGSLLPFRNHPRFIHDWLYVQDEFLRTNFVLTCAPNSDDPWLLATNLPPTRRVIRDYERRFGCEEFFSDMKARGFDVEKTQLRHGDRFNRLLIVLALLALWLWGVARRLLVTRQVAMLIQPSHTDRYSGFQLAYRWLERQIMHGLSICPDPKFRFGLLV